MLVIGLTGGIGCGKSLVSKLFKQIYDIPVIDADIIARELSTTPHVIKLLHTKFGNEYFDQNNNLLRDKLRSDVFSDDMIRKKLEDILHPLIYDDIQNKIDSLNTEYCIVAIPLLLEKNRKEFLDRILVVDCNEELQIKRVIARDNCSEAHVRAIINTQISRNERLRLADDIIENNGNIKLLKKQIKTLHTKYLDLNRQ